MVRSLAWDSANSVIARNGSRSRQASGVPGCRGCGNLVGSGISGILRFVRLAETIMSIRHSKSAILKRRHLEIVSGAVVLRCWRSLLALWRKRDRSHRHGGQGFIEQVRDEHAGHGIIMAAQQREVHLPEVDKTRGGEKHLHCFRLSPFASPIVHDRSSRMKRINQQVRIDVSVTSKEIQIHRTEAIARTHQVELPIQGQVAQDNRTKLSEGNETSDRLVIFGLGDICCLEVGTIGIWGTGARQRGLQHIAGRGYYAPVQTTDCYLIAGLYNHVFHLAIKFGITLMNMINS